MTPLEPLAAAGGMVSPAEEFGGIPRPNFLEEKLAAGQRAAAEKRRLADEAKAKLGAG